MQSLNKKIKYAVFLKGALIPTNFFLRKIDRFLLKKSTDHSRETVLFFRQACLLKFASLLSKIIYQKNLYSSSTPLIISPVSLLIFLSRLNPS